LFKCLWQPKQAHTALTKLKTCRNDQNFTEKFCALGQKKCPNGEKGTKSGHPGWMWSGKSEISKAGRSV